MVTDCQRLIRGGFLSRGRIVDIDDLQMKYIEGLNIEGIGDCHLDVQGLHIMIVRGALKCLGPGIEREPRRQRHTAHHVGCIGQMIGIVECIGSHDVQEGTSFRGGLIDEGGL